MSDLEEFKLNVGHYGFSATRLEDLGASEYCLATIICDDSSSVENFRNEMEKCVKNAVEACKKSPRADNMMIRVCTFSDGFHEVHGFKQLQLIKPSDYDGMLGRGGMTALCDACDNGVRATSTYGRSLLENDYSVNGIVFVITDGAENKSKLKTNNVREALKDATRQENLESLISILIGVNLGHDPNLKAILDAFHKEAGFTEFVALDDADAKTLAKLGQWISKSVSSQGQAIGSGGPSKVLTF